MKRSVFMIQKTAKSELNMCILFAILLFILVSFTKIELGVHGYKHYIYNNSEEVFTNSFQKEQLGNIITLSHNLMRGHHDLMC